MLETNLREVLQSHPISHLRAWLKVATTACTFQNLYIHLTGGKFGCQCKDHSWWVALRHYFQPVPFDLCVTIQFHVYSPWHGLMAVRHSVLILLESASDHDCDTSNFAKFVSNSNNNTAAALCCATGVTSLCNPEHHMSHFTLGFEVSIVYNYKYI